MKVEDRKLVSCVLTKGFMFLDTCESASSGIEV